MGKDNVVGVICGDKISTVLQWMLEEWIRLLKQANSEPEVRNIMTECGESTISSSVPSVVLPEQMPVGLR